MDLKTSEMPNKEIYHQAIPLFVVIVTIVSMVSTYYFYTKFSETESIVDLVLANVCLLIAIIFVKPIVEWRRIEIDDKSIAIYKFFFRPIRINISQSLYQVVMNNDGIRSYRFRVGDSYTQISPQAYVNGKALSKRLDAHIARNKLVIDAVY